MVSQHTMAFISVFSLMHQAAGTMGGHKSLYASGRKWLGKQIHAYTHAQCCGMFQNGVTHRIWLWHMIEIQLKLWSTFLSLCVCLSHSQTPSVCAHTHTHWCEQETRQKHSCVLECLTWWASSRSQGSFSPCSWPQVTVDSLTFWPDHFEDIRAKMRVKCIYENVQSCEWVTCLLFNRLDMSCKYVDTLFCKQ